MKTMSSRPSRIADDAKQVAKYRRMCVAAEAKLIFAKYVYEDGALATAARALEEAAVILRKAQEFKYRCLCGAPVQSPDPAPQAPTGAQGGQQ